MDNSAELDMVRQGEYTDFSLPAGVKEFALCAAKTFASVPEFVVCGYCLQAANDGQAVATAAHPASPSESPRYFAAGMDESIIVGYYTSAEVLPLRKQH